LSWDPILRVLVAEHSDTNDFAKIDTLKWRYAGQGRVLAYGGIEQVFQHDYRYDEHDNVVDFRLSYPEVFDPMTPSTASTWMGTSYQNFYDSNGRLSSSILTNYGPGYSSDPGPATMVFHEDTLGRCDLVTSTLPSDEWSEVRVYDENGRLWRAERTASSTSTACATSVQTQTYDDQGRIHSAEFSCQGSISIGSGSRTTGYTYRSDGSEVVESFDGMTDIWSERHRIVERSPGCKAIDADIGVPPDYRCRI
jgi:hypothetical protein